MSKQISQRTILGVLIGGFSLVIALLLLAGSIGLKQVSAIQSNAQTLVSQDLSATDLIDQIQSEQAALGWVFHRMAHDPETLDRDRANSQLSETEAHMQHLVQAVAGKPQEKLWRSLQITTVAFAMEARRLLAMETIPPNLSSELFRLNGKILELSGAIVRANDVGNAESQRALEQGSRQLVSQSRILLGSCVLLAILCAILTVRVTHLLFQRMELQASELSRVSWHMVENQETAARRFSHELHDELGQSLTAVKANLAALDPGEHANGIVRERLDDCLHQVNEAISNVRQLSQLLRPLILDDFGLDAALRWLTERFHQRTRIEVDYKSNFAGRLPDETETHLFRISQEALTNIARHSGATHVDLELSASDGQIRLSVADNGRGLPPQAGEADRTGKGGMGMTGMRARARSIGGEFTMNSGNSAGLSIAVSLPLTKEQALRPRVADDRI
jgi:signal transduction histidine kinase